MFKRPYVQDLEATDRPTYKFDQLHAKRPNVQAQANSHAVSDCLKEAATMGWRFANAQLERPTCWQSQAHFGLGFRIDDELRGMTCMAVHVLKVHSRTRFSEVGATVCCIQS